MLSLQKHHITDLYCVIDDLVLEPTRSKGGRPALLKRSEVITILVWNTLTMKQKTMKDIYHWLCLYHNREFPCVPTYSAFVKQCHAGDFTATVVTRAILDDS